MTGSFFGGQNNLYDWSRDDLSEYDDVKVKGAAKDNRSRMTREQKVAVLDEIFSNGGRYTMDELAKVSGFPRANVYRYKKVLEELHAPLVKDEKDRYYYSDKSFRIPHLMTTASQFKAAREMVSLLELIKNQPFYDDVKKVFDLLSMAAPKMDEYGDVYDKDVAGEASKPSRKIFLGAPCVGFSYDVWKIIDGAMEKNKNVAFFYTNVNGFVEHKTVQPWQLVFDRGNWDLWCYDYKRKSMRLLTLSQMSEVHATGDSFELPEDFDMRKRTPGAFGAYVGEKREMYRILFMKESYIQTRAVKRVWGWNQQIERDKDGNTIISFESNQFHPILNWVRSWGSDVRPLEPPALVEKWKKDIQELYRELVEGNGVDEE